MMTMWMTTTTGATRTGRGGEPAAGVAGAAAGAAAGVAAAGAVVASGAWGSGAGSGEGFLGVCVWKFSFVRCETRFVPNTLWPENFKTLF